jgi:hypothetical protein
MYKFGEHSIVSRNKQFNRNVVGTSCFIVIKREKDRDAAINKLQDANKPLKDPNADTEKKREKLISLSREGLVEKTPTFIRKANTKVVEKLYSEYESQRLTKANEFMTGLIISKFASILGGGD